MRYVDVEVEVDSHDVLDYLSLEDILDYLKNVHGFDADEVINQDLSRRLPPQNIREKLCDMFDLAALTPVDGILKAIEDKIR